MPLTSLISGIDNVPDEVTLASKKLRFRNTLLVYLLINSENIFSDQWLYIHDPTVLHGRVTNFRNWSPHIVNKNGTTVICMEFWCFEDDEIWNMRGEDLINLASKEVVQIGLVNEEQILEGKLVKTLVNQVLRSGQHVVNWDGTNQIGTKVSSGMYIYQLKTNSTVLNRRMTFMK